MHMRIISKRICLRAYTRVQCKNPAIFLPNASILHERAVLCRIICFMYYVIKSPRIFVCIFLLIINGRSFSFDNFFFWNANKGKNKIMESEMHADCNSNDVVTRREIF